MKRFELPASEYNPFYHNYILALGEDVTILEKLDSGRKELLQVFQDIPEEKMSYAYSKGKWTLAELLLHIMDAERVFQYRALRFARGDDTPLPGFDHDSYVPASNANKRGKQDLLQEYDSIRQSTIHLFRAFSEEMLKSIGVASGSEMSVRALGFIISGHQAHHLKIIKERYL